MQLWLVRRSHNTTSLQFAANRFKAREATCNSACTCKRSGGYRLALSQSLLSRCACVNAQIAVGLSRRTCDAQWPICMCTARTPTVIPQGSYLDAFQIISPTFALRAISNNFPKVCTSSDFEHFPKVCTKNQNIFGHFSRFVLGAYSSNFPKDCS